MNKGSGTNDVTLPLFSFLPVEDYSVLQDRCTRGKWRIGSVAGPSQIVVVVAALVLELKLWFDWSRRK